MKEILTISGLGFNLSFGWSSSESSSFAQQILGFSAEGIARGPLQSRKAQEMPVKTLKCEGELSLQGTPSDDHNSQSDGNDKDGDADQVDLL